MQPGPQGADAYVAAYSLSDTSKAMAEARQKAMANARENAAEVASEAGGSLGKVWTSQIMAIRMLKWVVPIAARSNEHDRCHLPCGSNL